MCISFSFSVYSGDAESETAGAQAVRGCRLTRASASLSSEYYTQARVREVFPSFTNRRESLMALRVKNMPRGGVAGGGVRLHDGRVCGYAAGVYGNCFVVGDMSEYISMRWRRGGRIFNEIPPPVDLI